MCMSSEREEGPGTQHDASTRIPQSDQNHTLPALRLVCRDDRSGHLALAHNPVMRRHVPTRAFWIASAAVLMTVTAGRLFMCFNPA
jgi:hypothetical protein